MSNFFKYLHHAHNFDSCSLLSFQMHVFIFCFVVVFSFFFFFFSILVIALIFIFPSKYVDVEYCCASQRKSYCAFTESIRAYALRPNTARMFVFANRKHFSCPCFWVCAGATIRARQISEHTKIRSFARFTVSSRNRDKPSMMTEQHSPLNDSVPLSLH